MRNGVTNTRRALTVIIQRDFHRGNALSREKKMINWIKNRMKERTSWDGAICIGLGLDSIHGTSCKDCMLDLQSHGVSGQFGNLNNENIAYHIQDYIRMLKNITDGNWWADKIGEKSGAYDKARNSKLGMGRWSKGWKWWAWQTGGCGICFLWF